MTNEITVIGGGVTAPRGYQASGVACGIKASGRPDLSLLYSDTPASCSAVFTQNSLAAAPINVAREQVKKDQGVRALVVNSGNANAMTGREGERNAWKMVEATAEALGVDADEVLLASTGVIGHQLDMAKVEQGIITASRSLSSNGGHDAAMAIITTDLVEKEFAVEVSTPKGDFRIGGMAKGSGMIAPSMATMIAVITTDLVMTKEQTREFLLMANRNSFNSITVDGCQSTNDVVFLMANGASGTGFPDVGPEVLADALALVCQELAKKIARDGEGATKLLEVLVEGAMTEGQAKEAALAVVSSDLVKTAMFGCDPNWGRILAAVGASAAELDPEKVSLSIGGLILFQEGKPAAFSEEEAAALLDEELVNIVIGLGRGGSSSKAWGCDLGYDYVKINAEYRT